MLKQSDISRIYFLGIGGIGMSAIARYFNEKGATVSGYDKSRTSLTIKLEEEGMTIHYIDSVELVDKQAQIVIYTPAIKTDNKEYVFFLQNNYTLLKRSEILGMITEDTFNICIAGTHGKTTISTMIGHILRDSKYGCNAFLGGISQNYETNFWSSENKVSVVEADEYDRSFLKLKPNVAIISSMDSDHLEIYGDKAGVVQGFMDFVKCIKKEGLLIYKYGLQVPDKLTGSRQLSYSLQDTAADAYAGNISITNGCYSFDVFHCGKIIKNIILRMGGMHNVENAVAAVSAALSIDIDEDLIRKALGTFKGIIRRFQNIGAPSDIHEEENLHTRPVFIDDYAHHPSELTALINGVRDLYPGRECVIIFQPHLFSRTKAFASEFAGALDLADRVILLPIYPARETAIPGITSEIILNEMKLRHKYLMSISELLNSLKDNKNTSVVVTAGAGDIDQLVEPIRQIIFKKAKLNND